MTDKVQLIKEEIERRYNCKKRYPLIREANVAAAVLQDLLLFIDSIPEESKKQPKFKVGDVIKGPCNNIFQVKKVLDTQYLLHSENGDELNSIEIVDKYSCLEESASEDLEESARYYLLNIHVSPLNDILHQADLKVEMQYHKDIEDAYKAGAEWHKTQMMEDAVDAFVNTYENTDDSNYVEFVTEQSPYEFKETEKCKIIIIK